MNIDGTVPAGGSVVRPVAWLLGEEPRRSPVKWAVDADGDEHWAEGEIRTLPYGVGS